MSDGGWTNEQMSEFTKRRWEMVRDLEPKLTGRMSELSKARVLQAMAVVPRHEFVPRAQVEVAYQDTSLPGDDGVDGKMLSPFVVGWMCGLVVEGIHGLGGMVGEVGGGRGYEAAVLVEAGLAVVSVQQSDQLEGWARDNLDRTNYDQRGVFVVAGDPLVELPQYAPEDGYNGMVVTAALVSGGRGTEVVKGLTGMVRSGSKVVYLQQVAGSVEVVLVVRDVGNYRQVEEKEQGRWGG